ncbi:MAG: hypothetical protein H0X29_10750, partial [Parachlamydiaceae bacterium]|nr:hypothetical protein [Parachlamydiaceae bacterium]
TPPITSTPLGNVPTSTSHPLPLPASHAPPATTPLLSGPGGASPSVSLAPNTATTENTYAIGVRTLNSPKPGQRVDYHNNDRSVAIGLSRYYASVHICEFLSGQPLTPEQEKDIAWFFQNFQEFGAEILCQHCQTLQQVDDVLNLIKKTNTENKNLLQSIKNINNTHEKFEKIIKSKMSEIDARVNNIALTLGLPPTNTPLTDDTHILNELRTDLSGNSPKKTKLTEDEIRLVASLPERDRFLQDLALLNPSAFFDLIHFASKSDKPALKNILTLPGVRLALADESPTLNSGSLATNIKGKISFRPGNDSHLHCLLFGFSSFGEGNPLPGNENQHKNLHWEKLPENLPQFQGNGSIGDFLRFDAVATDLKQIANKWLSDNRGLPEVKEHLLKEAAKAHLSGKEPLDPNKPVSPEIQTLLDQLDEIKHGAQDTSERISFDTKLSSLKEQLDELDPLKNTDHNKNIKTLTEEIDILKNEIATFKKDIAYLEQNKIDKYGSRELSERTFEVAEINKKTTFLKEKEKKLIKATEALKVRKGQLTAKNVEIAQLKARINTPETPENTAKINELEKELIDLYKINQLLQLSEKERSYSIETQLYALSKAFGVQIDVIGSDGIVLPFNEPNPPDPALPIVTIAKNDDVGDFSFVLADFVTEVKNARIKKANPRSAAATALASGAIASSAITPATITTKTTSSAASASSLPPAKFATPSTGTTTTPNSNQANILTSSSSDGSIVSPASAGPAPYITISKIEFDKITYNDPDHDKLSFEEFQLRQLTIQKNTSLENINNLTFDDLDKMREIVSKITPNSQILLEEKQIFLKEIDRQSEILFKQEKTKASSQTKHLLDRTQTLLGSILIPIEQRLALISVLENKDLASEYDNILKIASKRKKENFEKMKKNKSFVAPSITKTLVNNFLDKHQDKLVNSQDVNIEDQLVAFFSGILLPKIGERIDASTLDNTFNNLESKAINAKIDENPRIEEYSKGPNSNIYVENTWVIDTSKKNENDLGELEFIHWKANFVTKTPDNGFEHRKSAPVLVDLRPLKLKGEHADQAITIIKNLCKSDEPPKIATKISDIPKEYRELLNFPFIYTAEDKKKFINHDNLEKFFSAAFQKHVMDDFIDNYNKLRGNFVSISTELKMKINHAYAKALIEPPPPFKFLNCFTYIAAFFARSNAATDVATSTSTDYQAEEPKFYDPKDSIITPKMLKPFQNPTSASIPHNSPLLTTSGTEKAYTATNQPSAIGASEPIGLTT